MIPHIRTNNGFQALVDFKPHNVPDSHPHYEELLEATRAGDKPKFLSLIDDASRVQQHFSDTGVEVKDGTVYYNGEAISNILTTRILDYVDGGHDPAHMVAFLSNLMDNPSRRAVEELYKFLEHRALPITEDGCFLAYKAVRSNYLDKYSGKFDNSVGKVLEMPRNKVDDDKDRTCSHGFHVGALDYAGPDGWYYSYGDKVMIVKVNPKDAVSVPADHNAQKLRVCKYEVVGEYDAPLPDTFSATCDDYDDDCEDEPYYYDEEDYC